MADDQRKMRVCESINRQKRSSLRLLARDGPPFGDDGLARLNGLMACATWPLELSAYLSLLAQIEA